MPRRHHIRTFIIVSILVLAFAASAVEREAVPTPPGGGEGVHHVPVDDAYVPGAPARAATTSDVPIAPSAAGGDLKAGDIGGDDVHIFNASYVGDNSMAIASNGDIYTAVEIQTSYGYETLIHRSTDGGTVWTQFARLYDVDPDIDLNNPWICIAEGSVDRIFVAYTHRELAADHTEVHVSSWDLGTGALLSDQTVVSQAGISTWNVHMTTDAEIWSGFYLYLVVEVDDGNANDIWFLRSTDQGSTFEAPYAIASLSSTDGRGYHHPRVCYGYGGTVHVSWYYKPPTVDTEIRYRRADDYANGGLSAWGDIQYLTDGLNGMNEERPRIAASVAGNEVVITHMRLDGNSVRDPGVLVSTDAGASFAASSTISGGFWWPDALAYRSSTDEFILGGARYIDGLQTASASSPTTWSSILELSDRDYYGYLGLRTPRSLALDPSRGDRAALILSYTNVASDPDTLIFDAEWRRDPGYPNYETGYPKPLTYEPVGDPVAVDLDGDGDLEYLFPDESWLVRAYHHNGSAVDGWPVWFPEDLNGGSICAGDLDLTGEIVVVVGSAAGNVYAVSAGGLLLDGWPYAMPTASPVKVSIGAVGPVYPRSIVAVGGSNLRILGKRGQHVAHPYGWSMAGRTAVGPAAIGDVDGDGLGDIVCAFSDYLVQFDRDANTAYIRAALPDTPSEAVSLADLDLDGDVEMVVPMPDGTLHVYDGDGSAMPGWPWDSGSGSPLSRPAIANCLGSSEPEIAVVEKHWTGHLLYADGVEHYGWPVSGDGWFTYGSPIMDMLADPYSADMIVGARGEKAWAWSNFGNLVEGWPKPLTGSVYFSPASGDFDDDGDLEVLLLTDESIGLVDVNQTPGSGINAWQQYGYDARRTGCLDCPEDLVTAVDDDDRVTRASFAGASPNPASSGGTVFAFATPVRSAVELTVYDVRGRLVRTVVRGEVAAGEHVTAWDARDDDDRTVAEGQYLARLTIRGPGVRRDMTRKVTVIR